MFRLCHECSLCACSMHVHTRTKNRKLKTVVPVLDCPRVHERVQKDFLGPLFKKLGNHSSFYECNLGSNRAQKWRKLVLTSFRSLRELRASFPFISVAERQRLKLGMLEEKDTNCSRNYEERLPVAT